MSKVNSASHDYQIALLGFFSSIAMILLSIAVVIYGLISPGHSALLIFFLVLGVLSVASLAVFATRMRRQRSGR
jgi:heme/copper-type cytochrome/quinol oxidase subunit 4